MTTLMAGGETPAAENDQSHTRGERRGTKPTAGVPTHPVVTSVTFETTAGPTAEPVSVFATKHLARTVGHLEKVDVGAIVSSYLEAYDEALDPDALSECGGDIVGAEILRLTALVETVLDECRATLRTRMAMDIATILIPRLKGTRS